MNEISAVSGITYQDVAEYLRITEISSSTQSQITKEVIMINWKVRIKSKTFWLALIPAILLLVQTVAAVFGYPLDFDALQGRLLDVVNAAFLVLTILGIVVDPTTAGVSDSALAMTYEKPRESEDYYPVVRALEDK